MDIKFYWRKWTGKCILCGNKKSSHKICPHCLFSKYLCHDCGKYWGFASNYGMSKERILEVLDK